MSNKLSVEIDDSPKPLGKRISTAKRKGYSVIAVVGRESLESDKITCDLTGILDPHGKLLVDEKLKETVFQDGAGKDHQQGEGLKQLQTALRQQDLKQVKFAPAELKRLLLRMQDAYF
jgi:threonyl-tRNA synthetase